MHLQLTCFLFYKLHTFYFHVHSCIVLAFSFAKKGGTKKKQKKEQKEQKESPNEA